MKSTFDNDLVNLINKKFLKINITKIFQRFNDKLMREIIFRFINVFYMYSIEF